MKTIQRGEVHWVQLDPARGSEMAKSRPCVILSPREINDHRRTVVVVPLTTTETPASSKVRTEHIRAIDKSRLSGFITDIGADDLQEINRALCQVLAIKPLSA